MTLRGDVIVRRPISPGASDRLQRIAREALPPELAHLADGKMAEALEQAVAYAQHSVSPVTEKIYEDDWAAFEVSGS